MNRLIAISLLLIFMLHYLGYYFFYVATKYHINKEWESKIENRVLSEQDFNYLALPISLPYQPSQELYQPANESLEFDGKFYRLVKKRYANDTLHIIYVDDFKTQHLKKSFKEWINVIYQEKNPDSGRQIVISSFDKNYFLQDFHFEMPIPEIATIETEEHYTNHYVSSFVHAIDHPPKFTHLAFV